MDPSPTSSGHARAGIISFFWYAGVDRLRSPVLLFDTVGLSFSAVAGAQRRLSLAEPSDGGASGYVDRNRRWHDAGCSSRGNPAGSAFGSRCRRSSGRRRNHRRRRHDGYLLRDLGCNWRCFMLLPSLHGDQTAGACRSRISLLAAGRVQMLPMMRSRTELVNGRTAKPPIRSPLARAAGSPQRRWWRSRSGAAGQNRNLYRTNKDRLARREAIFVGGNKVSSRATSSQQPTGSFRSRNRQGALPCRHRI